MVVSAIENEETKNLFDEVFGLEITNVEFFWK